MIHPEEDPTKQLNALEHRIASISRMAFGISHEYNNILAAILSNAEAVLDRLEPDGNVRAYAERVASNTKKAITLTERVQMFTDNGSAEQKQVSLDLAIAETLSLLKDSIPDECNLCIHIIPEEFCL